MAFTDSALSELMEVFRSGEGTDFICECVRVAMQDLIDAEATSVIGAGRCECTESRTTERSGSRLRLLTTHTGDIQLAVPKLRTGSFFPSILSPRRRIDQALGARRLAPAVDYLVVAPTGVTSQGRREILGIDVGDSEDEVF